MLLDVISYRDLIKQSANMENKIKNALYGTGIIGVCDIPLFKETSEHYIQAAREFASLTEAIKQQYAPDRDAGDTEGYELGAEKFKDENGNWKIDNYKASFYAFVPDHEKNKWPREVNLKEPYLALAKLISGVGNQMLDVIGINESMGISHDKLCYYSRMLHYRMHDVNNDGDRNWCGAHFDHGVFTGLMPAYYFSDGIEVDEPDDAGLFIIPTNGTQFEKVEVKDKNILLFQVGEFGQLASNDQIRATKHTVKKAKGNIERFTFALFYNILDDQFIRPKSELTKDTRFTENCLPDGSIYFGKWADASYARYRAT